MITLSRGLTKGRAILMLISLFLSSMVTMADVVLSPIINNLYVEFAADPEWILNFAITGGALVSLVVMMIAGKMCDRYDKKIILVSGFACFAVGAICGGLVPSAYYFLAMRMLVYIGWGFVNTANFAIMADYFTDVQERGKVVGWYNCSMGLIGSVLTFASGMLTTIAWQNAFYAYLFAIPVLVMLVLFIPSFPPMKDAGAAEETHVVSGKVATGWWRPLVPLSIKIVLVVMVYTEAQVMISLFVSDAHLGDEMFVGTLTASITFATAVGALTFGYLYKKLKNAVYIPSLFAMGAAFLIMAFFPSQWIAVVCVIVIGFSYPMFYSYFYTRATEVVPPQKSGSASGVAGVMESLGYALSSYALTTVMVVAGLRSSLEVWPFFGVILLAVGAASVAGLLYAKAKAGRESTREISQV